MSSARAKNPDPVDTGELLAIGRRCGLAAVGVAAADVLEPARSVIELRKEAGLAGDMQFTYRNPARSCDPKQLLPSARSIVAAAWSYGQWSEPPAGEPDRTARDRAARDRAGRAKGRVARYSWRDHYADLRAALQPMADELKARGYRAVIVADTNALVDRNVAWLAGLGWYGKNSNLLLPDSGSWYVLGAIVTDAELSQTGPPLEDGCGSCSQCIDDCPTGAIVAPGVVDATRCLAWLVQAGGSIPVEFREAVGDRLYGCDDCQDVCPPNKAADRPNPQPLGDLSDGASLLVEAAQASVDIEWVLTADDAEIEASHGRWYIADRNVDVIRRTALVVLGNTATPETPEVEALLNRYLDSDVAELRIHAAWAARRLGRSDLAEHLPTGSLPETERLWEVTARFSPADWESGAPAL